MSQEKRLDTIRTIISRNSDLGEIYKQNYVDDYVKMLKKEMCIEDIDEDEIDAIVYVYSNEPAQFWDKTLKSSIKTYDQLQKAILSQSQHLQFKLTIRNKDEYFATHSSLSQIQQYIAELYDQSYNDLKQFVNTYYNNEIHHYVNYAQLVHSMRDSSIHQFEIHFNKSWDEISDILYHEIRKEHLSINEFLPDKECLYSFLIKHELIRLSITISTTQDIVKLDHIILSHH